MATVEIQQLSSELANLTRTIQQMVQASSRTIAAQQAAYMSHMEATEELEAFRKQLVGNRQLTKQQQVQLHDAIKLKREEIRAARAYAKAQQHATTLSQRNNVSEALKTKAAQQAAHAQQRWKEKQVETEKATSLLNTSFTATTKSVNLANASLVWFGSTLRQQGTQLLAQNAANSGVIEGSKSLTQAMLAQQNAALRFGLTPEQFAQISTANRQVINSLGGTSKAMDRLQPSIERMTILTGDFNEGARLAAETATELAKKGIRPTQVALEEYTNDIVQLQKRTGMSTREAAAYFNEIASDTDSIDLLRKARASERESILRSQRALVDQALAAGMSAEQAKAAAKMLNQMVAAKPLDRIKQAAKIRALGGAMGIAGSDEAAQAVMKGSRASDQEKQALARYGQEVTNMVDQSAQQGIQAELVTSTLVDKLNLDQYYGKGSPFSTTMGETLKPAFADIAAAYKDASQSLEGKIAYETGLVVKQLELIVSGNHWSGVMLSGIAAGVATVVTLMSSGKLIDKAKGLVGKAAGGADDAAKAVVKGKDALGAVDDIANASSKMAKASSALSSTAKILGPLASVGIGAYEGYTKYEETGEMGTAVGRGVGTAGGSIAGGWGGAVAGAAGGAAIGSVVPIVGTALGGIIGGVLGGIGGGMLGGEVGGWGGEKVGKMVSNANKPSAERLDQKVSNWVPDQPPSTKSVDISKPDATASAIKETTAVGELIKDASMTTASGITQQLKKMDASADLLKKIATMAEKQVDLAERQLVAITMTESERQKSDNKRQLRSDNRFATRYNYL